jgi:hypothetical protein
VKTEVVLKGNWWVDKKEEKSVVKWAAWWVNESVEWMDSQLADSKDSKKAEQTVGSLVD